LNDHGGGGLDFLHHLAARHVALQPPDLSLDLRVPFLFLAFVAKVLFAHAQICV